MIVSVDSTSNVPLFEQLRSQFTRMIAAGQLQPGAKLPPIRQLAGDLGLSRGTINKVYDALAHDGLVETRGRHGTTVCATNRATVDAVDLDAAAAGLALVARQIGASDREAHEALSRALGQL